MKTRPLIALALLTFAASNSFAKEKSEDDGFTVTVGVERSRNSITGGSTDKAEISPLFDLEYRSGRFFAGTSQGIGYEFLKTDSFLAFAALGYNPGRQESKAGDKKDNPRLVGMGKIKGSGMLMIGVGAAPLDGLVNLQAMVARSTVSKQGTTARLGAGVGFPIWGNVGGSINIGANYADSNHMKTFYGVTAAQSLRSGNAVFTPKAGFESSSVGLGLEWEIDKQWSASAGVERTQLLGDAKKSTLFKNKTDTSISLSVSYRF
jgi:MipA family protein